MADTKITALTADTTPTLDDLVVTVNAPGSSPSNRKVALSNLGAALGLHAVTQGRLTTESGVPISTSDRTAQTSIYFTPYHGNRVGLYTGSAWAIYSFTEVSFGLPTLTSAKNYDVFLYDNAGVLTLELSAAWNSDTTRFASGPYASIPPTQDGIYVKSTDGTLVDASRRLIGTIRTTNTTTTEDSIGKRFVTNAENLVERYCRQTTMETTNSWSYTTASFRQARASALNQFEVVQCLAERPIRVAVCSLSFSSTNSIPAAVGVGVDSTTVNSAPIFGSDTANVVAQVLRAEYYGVLGVGYHTLAWLEYGGTNMNFYGDNGTVLQQSGIFGNMWL